LTRHGESRLVKFLVKTKGSEESMTKILVNQWPKFWLINGQNFGESMAKILVNQWPAVARQLNGQNFGDQ